MNKLNQIKNPLLKIIAYFAYVALVVWICDSNLLSQYMNFKLWTVMREDLIFKSIANNGRAIFITIIFSFLILKFILNKNKG